MPPRHFDAYGRLPYYNNGRGFDAFGRPLSPMPVELLADVPVPSFDLPAPAPLTIAPPETETVPAPTVVLPQLDAYGRPFVAVEEHRFSQEPYAHRGYPIVRRPGAHFGDEGDVMIGGLFSDIGHAFTHAASSVVNAGKSVVKASLGVVHTAEADAQKALTVAKSALSLPSKLVDMGTAVLTKTLGPALKAVGLGKVADLLKEPANLLHTINDTTGHVAATLLRLDPAGLLKATSAGAQSLAINPLYRLSSNAVKLIPAVGPLAQQAFQSLGAVGKSVGTLGSTVGSVQHAFGAAPIRKVAAAPLDLAIVGARAAIAQASPAAVTSFDLGVGAAHTKTMNDAEILSLQSRLATPAMKAAFDVGLHLARREAVTPEMLAAILKVSDPSSRALFVHAWQSAQSAVAPYMKKPAIRKKVG